MFTIFFKTNQKDSLNNHKMFKLSLKIFIDPTKTFHSFLFACTFTTIFFTLEHSPAAQPGLCASFGKKIA
ncbi:hypothetical protein psyc5s11_24480 [Clostridium gelidum]|uniref:Uncharacterized protein n=1 Tax=Clostridium gelidum TaxID=704125 RepID=A0ABN6J0A3_9CLOT|nr:hypothetical protein psyc5s11_24480 [Clostridium gelidum]